MFCLVGTEYTCIHDLICLACTEDRILYKKVSRVLPSTSLRRQITSCLDRLLALRETYVIYIIVGTSHLRFAKTEERRPTYMQQYSVSEKGLIHAS